MNDITSWLYQPPAGQVRKSYLKFDLLDTYSSPTGVVAVPEGDTSSLFNLPIGALLIFDWGRLEEGKFKTAKDLAPDFRYMRYWKQPPAPPINDPDYKWGFRIPVLVDNCGDVIWELAVNGVFGTEIIGTLQNAFVRSPQASEGQLPFYALGPKRRAPSAKRSTTYWPPTPRSTGHWCDRSALEEVLDIRMVPPPPAPPTDGGITYGPSRSLPSGPSKAAALFESAKSATSKPRLGTPIPVQGSTESNDGQTPVKDDELPF